MKEREIISFGWLVVAVMVLFVLVLVELGISICYKFFEFLTK